LNWEQWRISLDIVRSEEGASAGSSSTGAGGSASEAARAELEARLNEVLMHIVRVVNDKKEHIPPVVSKSTESFPFEISVPNENDASFGFTMIRKMLQSTPPSLV